MTSIVWTYTVGDVPHRVAAYENAERKGVVYLKWRVAGDWRRMSLGFGVRNAKGGLDKIAVGRAVTDANAQYQRLLGIGAIPQPVAALTIAGGWTLATDEHRGHWNKDTPHRREMDRAIQRAKSYWGAQRTWNSIERGDIRELWRKELKRVRGQDQPGARSAEIIVARVLALASWLRDEGKIAPTACLPWKQLKLDMAKDIGTYEPHRPRYTLDEYRALIATAPDIDPRWGLLLAIGAEYRLGQVVRCMRSALHLEKRTLVIAGSGKKKGTTVHLTDAQRHAVSDALGGHLAALEADYLAGNIADYALFPGGHLPAGAMTRAVHASREPMEAGHQLREWLDATEAKARVGGKPIAHVEGRGWYGLRRAAVDAVKAAGITREGLQQSGGWSNTQVPDAIYAEQEQSYAGQEAAKYRAMIRGETDAGRTQTKNDAEASSAANPLTDCK